MLLTAAAWWSATTYGANALGETRTISIFNIHTKETITVTFKRDGKYDDDALARLNTFMRDWRVNQETKMDPVLIDHIWTLHKELGSTVPVHLICGYRTAETNANLRKHGGGQAKKSQHILGKAADITFPDVPVKVLRNSALVAIGILCPVCASSGRNQAVEHARHTTQKAPSTKNRAWSCRS